MRWSGTAIAGCRSWNPMHWIFFIWLGKRMRNHGAEFAIGAMAINLVWASILFFQNMTEGIVREVYFEIANIGLFEGRELVFELTDQGLSFGLDSLRIPIALPQLPLNRDDLDRLRDALPLAEIVGRRVQLVKAGREFSGLCPFHNGP